MKRRKFLKATGAGIAATGLAGVLAAHRAPVFAQANTIHILRWNDFVPAADKVLREVYVPEVQKDLGIKLNVETVNANDIPARATAGIQSGSGPDIIMLLNNYPHLYASSGVDVSDIAEEVNKSQGGIYGSAAQLNKVGSQWVSMPWSTVPAMIAYRKSWFEEVGAKEFPKTWAQYHEVGKRLKAAKRPIGQTLGNTFGDAPTFTYPFLWSFGGQELDKGKVVLDSKETLESVRFMTQFWKDAHDEGGLAWDDSNNNRAFLSGDICASLNGASIYVAALNGADKFKTEKGAPLHTDILHAALPAGPKGQHAYGTSFNHMVMKYSKNAKGGKELLRWMHTKANYDKWFVVQKGFAVGIAQDWENHAMWNNDPVMAPFRTIQRQQTRLMGYGGAPDKRAAEAWNKFIITVMYAQAAGGKMSPEQTVKWAAGELGKIYT
jgi:multiple sugar transport system substrate-binding protein